MEKKLILYVIIIFCTVHNGFGQNEIKKAGTLFNENRFKIDLYIQKSNKPCGVEAIKNSFRLTILNLKTFYSVQKKFINWKMDIVNCNDEIIQKTISVDLGEIMEDERKLDEVREFEGSEIIRSFYDVTFTAIYIKTDDIVKGRTKSEVAQSISGKREINSKEITELTVNGGSLMNGAEWVWYKDGCGKIEIGRGVSVNLSPEKTTTYYVRAEDPKKTYTQCISETVVVDDDSKPAVKVIGNNTFCEGSFQNEKLYVEGGKLGVDAKWVWYENSCPVLGKSAKKIGEGGEILVKPEKTITYYVRAEGLTNTTFCTEFKMEFIESSIMPKSIKVSDDKVCENAVVTLQVEGGKLSSNANWVWFEKRESSNKKLKIGSGSSINVQPVENTEYFVETEGDCMSGIGRSVKVEIRKKSNAASYISYFTKTGQKKSQSLTVIGGSLAENAQWVWYLDKCGGKKLGSGKDIVYSSNKSHTVYVRAEGGCNVTNCVSSYIPAHKRKASKYFFINAGIGAYDLSIASNFMVTVGTKLIYLRVKFPASFSNNNQPVEASYECNDNAITNYPSNSGTYYQFNDKVYVKTTSFTAGVKFGGKILRGYLGGGYGIREIYWGVDIYRYSDNNNVGKNVWAKNIVQSITGPEAEAGLFIKFGKFNIMGGANMVFSTSSDLKYIGADLGIGFSF